MDVWQEIIKDREHGARILVAVYKDRLFASALILCRDRRAAEELVFRTFARAIDKISSFRPNTNFYNWLYTIMINFRRMDIRKENGSPLTFTDALPETPTEETPYTALAAKADHAVPAAWYRQEPSQLRARRPRPTARQTTWKGESQWMNSTMRSWKR